MRRAFTLPLAIPLSIPALVEAAGVWPVWKANSQAFEENRGPVRSDVRYLVRSRWRTAA